MARHHFYFLHLPLEIRLPFLHGHFSHVRKAICKGTIFISQFIWTLTIGPLKGTEPTTSYLQSITILTELTLLRLNFRP